MKNGAPARRTIPELVARYILEPSLRDVYVEGSDDRALIKWFLEQHERSDYSI